MKGILLQDEISRQENKQEEKSFSNSPGHYQTRNPVAHGLGDDKTDTKECRKRNKVLEEHDT